MIIKYKIQQLLSDFGLYLWNKFRTISATELLLIREADYPRNCEHCGLSPIHTLDNCECRKYTLLKTTSKSTRKK